MPKLYRMHEVRGHGYLIEVYNLATRRWQLVTNPKAGIAAYYPKAAAIQVIRTWEADDHRTVQNALLHSNQQRIRKAA